MKYIFFIFLFTYNSIYLFSQIDTLDYEKINTQLNDSLSNTNIELDSLSFIANNDTLSVYSPKKSKSGLDTIIEMKAKDTITFNLKDKTMRLKNTSLINMGGRNLESEEIIVRFNDNTLEALKGIDTSGNEFGFPKLVEKGEEYYGERILYNYKTGKGVISQGETELSEGYYYGKKIKKLSQDEFNIQDGFYTPCDEESPSAYFGSSKMKMIGKNKIFLDPIIFYVQDIPLLVYPFGLYFNMQSGRKSGFIVPQFDISGSRGLVFQEFGYYWAASDYFDAKFSADFYSKGGYVGKTLWRFKKSDDLTGNIDLQYGKTKFNLEEDFQDNYSVKVTGFNWTITPQDRINGSFIYQSQNFNQRTVSNLNQRLTQNANSNIAYARNFDNGSNLSIYYARNQQIITDEFDQTPKVEFNLPNKSLFKIANQDFNFSYSGRAELNHSKSRELVTFREEDDFFTDTVFNYDSRYYAFHNPRITYNLPKFWNLNVQPTINLGMNNFLRKIERSYDEDNDEIIDREIRGFFAEYWWSTGARVQTRLYGITQAPFLKKIGLKGARHTVEPAISYNFRPDQSNSSFYDSYIGRNGQEIQYRVFEKDGGGGSSSNRASQNLSYNLNNKFEVKVDKGDSVEAQNLELLNMNFNGSYDFERDSLKFSDIRANFNTPVLEFLNFSGNLSLSMYDFDPVFHQETNEIISYRKVDRFLIESNKGFFRLEQFDIGIGTSFSDKGISLRQQHDEDIDDEDSTQTKTKKLGGRLFNPNRRGFDDFDMFGDNSPGFAPLDFKWNVNININYSNNRRNPLNVTETFRFQAMIDLNLTETLQLSGGINYDFINKEITAPQIRVYKDLGCWDMSLNWTPVGIHRSMFFRIGLKASQLKDFQYLLRESNIY